MRKKRAMIGVLSALAILTCLFFWEWSAATQEWFSCGGNIGTEMNWRLGPEWMTIGTAPGTQVENDFSQIRKAALRLNRVSGCRKLSIGGLNCSDEELSNLVGSLRLVELHIQEMELAHATKSAIVFDESLIVLSLGNAGSASFIRDFLENNLSRTVSISGIKMSDSDRASLQKKFGSRLLDWDWPSDQIGE